MHIPFWLVIPLLLTGFLAMVLLDHLDEWHTAERNREVPLWDIGED